MNSEDMMLGEIGHSQMDKYTDYIYTYIIYIYGIAKIPVL